jgi:hypothetical protein
MTDSIEASKCVDVLTSEEHVRMVSELIGEAIRYLARHPMKFHIISKDLTVKDFDLNDDFFESLACHLQTKYDECSIESLTKLFGSENAWNYVPFPGIRNLTARSSNFSKLDSEFGITPDDYIWNIKSKTDLTLHDFAEDVYRFKTSPYEYWNELFCHISIRSCSDDNMDIDVEYDHGS